MVVSIFTNESRNLEEIISTFAKMVTSRSRVQNKRILYKTANTQKNENGAPGAVRTRDLRFRKPLLYPTELQVRSGLHQMLAIISTKTR